MYQQLLPYYKHDFLQEARFAARESEHYIFHFFPQSFAEKEIEQIVCMQEISYTKIIELLQVPAITQKIEYFFYPDEETKTNLMGDDWYAQSIYNEMRVHVLYTEDIKPIGPHEDTHLLSLPWGLSIGLFQEGLAEYMVGHAWDNTPHADYVKQGLELNIFPPIHSFMRHEAWLETDDNYAIYFYSLFGTFTKFLIENYGFEKFKHLYTTTSRENSELENTTICEKTYGTSIAVLSAEFKTWVMLQ